MACWRVLPHISAPGWSPEHTFGRKGEPKIMHRLESRAERSGYWQACLEQYLEWGLRWTVRYSTRHGRNDNPYMLSVGGKDARAVGIAR